MTVADAIRIIGELESRNNLTEEEEFEYTEALGFMIAETADPRYMMSLGGYYYGQRNFELALKYYDMAAALDYEEANECLGYVWYYGRTGEKDYEKAFKYFSAAAEKGNPVARYKIADMYHYGYYVEKNEDEYERIIESLYEEISHPEKLTSIISMEYYPQPGIYYRLARIRAAEGRISEAICLFLT